MSDDGEAGPGERSPENPFDELGDGNGDATLDAEVEELFTEVDVDEIDEESLWEELGGVDGGAASTEISSEAEPVAKDIADSVATEDDGVIVPKSRYCHQCEYFTAPPEIACENPGTEIMELVDIDHFRVQNCPVVRLRRGGEDIFSEDS